MVARPPQEEVEHRVRAVLREPTARPELTPWQAVWMMTWSSVTGAIRHPLRPGRTPPPAEAADRHPGRPAGRARVEETV